MRSLGCECYRDAHKEDGSEPDWKPLDGDAGSGRQPARSTERHPKVATNRGHRDGGGQTFPLAGGQLRSERAELCGEKSFHIFVLPGAGSQHAQFDPSAWTYRPATPARIRTKAWAADGRRSSRRFHAGAPSTASMRF